MLSVNQCYTVSDELDQPLFYIVRRNFPLRVILAVFGGIAAGLIAAGIVLSPLILSGTFQNSQLPAWAAVNIIAAVLVFVAVLLIVGTMLVPRRHVQFFTKPEGGELLLEVLEDSKWQLVNKTFTVRDEAGDVIARLRKNMLTNLLRKRWNITPEREYGVPFCAFEDSWVRAILRRFLGRFGAFLITNFVISSPDGVIVYGVFNRKFSVVDKYVLDLSIDADRMIDRRVAIALGVMLDTGERR